jgi:predicted MFS family arabinose efflux permease
MGLFHAVNGIAMLLASLLVGILWTAIGSQGALHFGGLLAGFSLLLLFCWSKRISHPE